MGYNNTFQTIQQLNYQSRYLINKQGLIIDTANNNLLQLNKKQQYTLKTKEGRTKRVSIKKIYRQVYNKEYCIDNIQNLKDEEWKPIDKTGKYFISNQGRVKSYQGYNAKILKPYPNQKGYLRVDIRINGYRKACLVHALVAAAFIINDDPLLNDTVDHIDLDKQNNRASNLRYLPRAINASIYQEQKRLKELAQNVEQSELEDNNSR